ncbi:MAG: MBL fold metallo-hydrolase [Myxococcota bacterium]|jgi:glyoxylase-like metal-dependent hydrolase (beta-lactamase superfamily II)|nr:MBL fold metallo-hydrolase [Myxococcota bacterium]
MANPPDLFLIDLPQDQPGFRNFLSAWLVVGDPCFVVDPGPASTVPLLIDSLRRLGVARLDVVLATHIHLDHSGGAAELLEAFPEARFHCHALGREHVISPAKLWQGSLKVLGDVARMYGEPRPVPAERFTDDEALLAIGIGVIDAPGHAAHHHCYLHDDCLFVGEALGTRQSLPSGRPYLRPATPPRFFLDQALSTIERLAALDPEPRRVAFAHHGLVEDGVRQWCARAREQLLRWVSSVQTLQTESKENLEERLFEHLMATDPFYGLGAFDELEDELKFRELHFLRNTLSGILSTLEASAT